MKSIYNYIISTNNRYNNITDIDGNELILNSEITERDAQFVNRIGVVQSVPFLFATPVQEGDEVIVHHNVFRKWFDKYKREKDSSSFLGENQFSVYPDQIFGYKRDGIWKGTPGFCFVEPILSDDRWSVANKKGLTGILAFGDEESPTEGTKIGFTPDSEYEFIIEGKLLYRVLSNQLTHEYNKGKTEGSPEGSGERVETTDQGARRAVRPEGSGPREEEDGFSIISASC